MASNDRSYILTEVSVTKAISVCDPGTHNAYTVIQTHYVYSGVCSLDNLASVVHRGME